jgi:hypothetical protein
MAASELVPDYGPGRPHPTAGAVAIGVRPLLIAYNVELRTRDRAVAQAIARRIRSSSGGLPHLKALGFEHPTLPRPGIDESHRLSGDVASGRIRRRRRRSGEDGRCGRAIEIVGLIPEDAAFEGMVSASLWTRLWNSRRAYAQAGLLTAGG